MAGSVAGIDWASEKHDVLIANEHGERLLGETFAHDEQGSPTAGFSIYATRQFVRLEWQHGQYFSAHSSARQVLSLIRYLPRPSQLAASLHLAMHSSLSVSLAVQSLVPLGKLYYPTSRATQLQMIWMASKRYCVCTCGP